MTDSLFLSILSDHLNGRTTANPKNYVDWERLLTLAEQHEVIPAQVDTLSKFQESISVDKIYTEMKAHLMKSIQQLNVGKGTAHELIEDDE